MSSECDCTWVIPFMVCFGIVLVSIGVLISLWICNRWRLKAENRQLAYSLNGEKSRDNSKIESGFQSQTLNPNSNGNNRHETLPSIPESDMCTDPSGNVENRHEILNHGDTVFNFSNILHVHPNRDVVYLDSAESSGYSSPLTLSTLSLSFFGDAEFGPMVGQNWQFSDTLTFKGGIIQKRDSDVRLYVPRDAVEGDRTVKLLGAVSTDLAAVSLKVALPSDQVIVSPVVEYSVGIQFKKSVQITLPLLQPTASKAKTFRVLYFWRNSDGEITVGDFQRESYHFSDDANSVCIETDHFSGFFCVMCRSECNPPSLYLELFGRYTEVRQGSWEVALHLEIWDSEIKDFRKDRAPRGESLNCMNMKLVDTKKLNAIINADSNDRTGVLMRLTLDENSQRLFEHKRLDGAEAYPAEELFVLEPFIVCQHHHSHDRKDWILVNKEDVAPPDLFSCWITVNYGRRDSQGQLNFLEQYRKVLFTVNIPQNGSGSPGRLNGNRRSLSETHEEVGASALPKERRREYETREESSAAKEDFQSKPKSRNQDTPKVRQLGENNYVIHYYCSSKSSDDGSDSQHPSLQSSPTAASAPIPGLSRSTARASSLDLTAEVARQCNTSNQDNIAENSHQSCPSLHRSGSLPRDSTHDPEVENPGFAEAPELPAPVPVSDHENCSVLMIDTEYNVTAV